MANYVTQLSVSTSKEDEQKLTARGFKKILVNLNKCAGGSDTFLWFKKGSTGPITRIQFSFAPDMNVGLMNAGYTKISENLNAGTGGDPIHLWYFRGCSEYDGPIVDIDITTSANDEPAKYKLGYERSACDLNRSVGGDWIHLWVKKEKPMYICDVIATESFGSDQNYFNQGYTRVDETTNRGAGGADVFIWFRQTISAEKALTSLNVSTNDPEYQSLQQQGYNVVSVNLNEGNSGELVYLWHKKDEFSSPIKDISVLVNPSTVVPYLKAGVQVIERSLNNGNCGVIEYVCYNQ